MGNALQTLMALPLGLGQDEAVTTITSRGVEHTITLRVNRLAGRIDVERLERPVADAPGTVIALARPPQRHLLNGGRAEVVGLLNAHAWLNPHAEIRFGEHVWEATATVAKWTPGMPIPAHWYSLERFVNRVLAEVRRDPQLTVSQFLEGFHGLKGTVKRARVAADAGFSYRALAALLDGTSVDHDRARKPLCAMQDATRAPKHTALGAVGRETFTDWAIALNHGSGRDVAPPFLTYHVLDGVLSDGDVSHEIPYRWEIGFCHLPHAEGRQLLIGQNFSPSIVPAHTAEEVLAHAPIPGSARTSRSRCSCTGSRPPARRSTTASAATPWARPRPWRRSAR
jgi:hypothetical protein